MECAVQNDKRAKLVEVGGKKKYMCKDCYAEGRKRQRKKNAEVDEDDDMSDQSDKVEKLIDTDPEALKFKESTKENMQIDKVIKREIYWIEKGKEAGVDEYKSDSSQANKKRKKDGRRKTQYSAYYNFYFELCFRLKKRMKQEIMKFKFHKETIQE